MTLHLKPLVCKAGLPEHEKYLAEYFALRDYSVREQRDEDPRCVFVLLSNKDDSDKIIAGSRIVLNREGHRTLPIEIHSQISLQGICAEKLGLDIKKFATAEISGLIVHENFRSAFGMGIVATTLNQTNRQVCIKARIDIGFFQPYLQHAELIERQYKADRVDYVHLATTEAKSATSSATKRVTIAVAYNPEIKLQERLSGTSPPPPPK